ncbi:MAG: hypothetical protein M5U26_23835 [Planctomycetota bacterium]|nr:hypothetical protein [Planctomycetota bacterium]
MHAEPYFNHDAFYAYCDRWMQEDDTEHCREIRDAGSNDRTKIEPRGLGRQGYCQAWVADLWRIYRNNLPAGPDGKKTPSDLETWK